MSELNPYSPPTSIVTNEEGESVLATRGERLGGWIVDIVLLAILSIPVTIFSGLIEKILQGEQSFKDILFSGATNVFLYFLVNGYLLARHGQTVGKRVVGTMIVSISDGKILPFWKFALMRYLPFKLIGLIPFLGVLINLVDILFIFREDKRCIHDHLAGTKVVQVTSNLSDPIT